jgi:hypothetical protein
LLPSGAPGRLLCESGRRGGPDPTGEGRHSRRSIGPFLQRRRSTRSCGRRRAPELPYGPRFSVQCRFAARPASASFAGQNGAVDASLILSIIAIAVAISSLALAVRTDLRQQRAEKREEQRAHREEADAIARRRGRPIFTPRGGSGGSSAFRVKHDYLVRNLGMAPITELSVWIEDGKRNRVSNIAGGIALTPPDAPVHLSVEVPQPLPDEQMLIVR